MKSKSKLDLLGELQALRGRVVALEARVVEDAPFDEVLQNPAAVTRLMLENANDAIYVVQNGSLKFVNEKTVEIIGYGADELKVKRFLEFVHPDDREIIHERHQRRLRGEVIPNMYPFRIVGRDGSIQWIEVNNVLITWQGQPATLCFMRDITEKKKAEDAIRQSERELKAKTRTLREMNTALKVLLKQREDDNREIEGRFLLNVKKLVLPYVLRLKAAKFDPHLVSSYLDIIEGHLQEIISPFLAKLTSKYGQLTPREIQVASLIKDGMTTKEIAGTLNISTNSVDIYRQNIRKKMGLNNKKTNLRTFFSSIPNN